MNIILINKKLTLFPTHNFIIIYNVSKLFYSQLVNNYIFSARKYFSRKPVYSKNADYHRYYCNNLVKNNFLFLKNKNMSNENYKKKVDEIRNNEILRHEIKNEEIKINEVKYDEIKINEVKYDEKNKGEVYKEQIKNNLIINNVLENNKLSSDEIYKKNLLRKEEVFNSMNYKKWPNYNFDPSLKTKKIQIYYNCEMSDMERKIKKVKKFLLNSSPVDILLIYNIDDNVVKSLKKKRKKCKQDEHEKYQNFETNKITKFVETQKLKESKFSLHIYIKVNLILNCIKNISIVDQIFRHFKNNNHIILIKAYPK